MKNALVTGSSRGIGAAIAHKLSANNIFVYTNSRHAMDSIKNNQHIIADVSNLDAIDIINNNINAPIDYIILNAGTKSSQQFGNITLKAWEKTFRVNVTYPLLLLQKLKDKLSSNASIVFVSSILGEYPHATSLDYGVSKAALNSLTRNLVKAFIGTNIRVNAILPGFINNTDWHLNKTPDHIERIKNKIPSRRFGTPEEVANLTFEILNNQYINGGLFHIDGGYSL